MKAILHDIGLLVLRLGFAGFMVVGHGWAKLSSFGALSDKFPDPLGIGSFNSLMGAVSSEFFAGLLVMVGLATRVAVLPMIFSMAVAVLFVHTHDPVFLPANPAKEPALVYLLAFVALLLTGPGRFSLDEVLWRRLRSRKTRSAPATPAVPSR